MKNSNLEEFEAVLGKSLGPVLRSAKKKVEPAEWGQVAEVLDMKTLRKKKFFKVCFVLSLL